ncbi:hypothetical protein CH330_04035 [candidate division WOR-3 bacterium JGI_Cruoil_03_51_56]|uniref:Uncharacterized protein n=1 Tax=candidate division WOR-3 bacterium JGI_Cruoil_03_51_56 TaxID=1973747 RepID=A0A235BUI4_UNCW3|nr:MAG: hypothetical protein CH330_04035 [candidate division WOR-3 bacterium JGI_Cruoil_03_51_56]
MASLAIKMGLAIRRLDAELIRNAQGYPAALPATHLSALQGWEFPLEGSGGMLVRYTREEFAGLEPLKRQVEVNRAHAEATLVLARAGEVELDEDEEELLFQRAVGILPSEEGRRFAEIAACAHLEPGYMTSSPERYVKGITDIIGVFGQATGLGYGFLLMAGIRSVADLVKYGIRLQRLFDSIVQHHLIADMLDDAENGISGLTYEERIKLLHAMRNQLWQMRQNRVGRFLPLTQVVDGYLGLTKDGIGDATGLAVLDSIMVGKMSFPVSYLVWKGHFYLRICVSRKGIEYWDPVDRHGTVPLGRVRKVGILDIIAKGYLRMAQGYSAARSYANGSRVARWVLGMGSESAEVYGVLGQCILGQGQARKAIELCDQALRLDSKLASVHLVKGNAYAMLSRWPEAIKSYKKAISRRAGFAEAFNNLGLALAKNGEPERAHGAYREAIRIRPDYVEAYYNLGNLHLERKEYDKGIDAYQKAVQHNPRFAGAYYNLGQAYYAKGELRLALEAYQAAVHVNPKHAGAWHNMGIVYRDLGEKERAAEVIEKAVELNPILFR